MPVVTYVDPDSIHNPSSGGVAPATWFTTVEADFRSITGRVGCSLTASSNQSVTAPGTTTITLGTVQWNNGMTTGAVANAITVPTSYAGKYMISATMRLTHVPSGSNFVTLDVLNNGAGIFREYADRVGAAGGVQAFACQFPFALIVGDDLTLSTTMSANTSTGSTNTSVAYVTLAAVWLSA
jgi:hypothetical protein